MKKSAYFLSLLVILLPFAGCLSSEENVPGCPDNPPDGTACLEWISLESRLWASYADLGMADLRDAELRGAIMWKANLSGADLRGADLRGANLRGADLSGADLGGANLRGAISDPHTNWEGAIADKSGLMVLEPGSELDGVDLTSFFDVLGIGWIPEEEGWITVGEEELWFIIDTTAPDLSGAILSNSNMSGVNLMMTNFSGANLRGADLSGAALRLANLSGADLSGADLSGANIDWADLTGADLSNAELFDLEAHLLRGCPSHLPEGWSCLFPEAGRSGSECLTEDDEQTREEFAGALEGLNLEFCDGFLLGPDSVLRSADVTGYNLSGVDLSGARIFGLDPTGPMLACPASLPEGFDCRHDHLLGNFSWVLGADFSGLDLNGVKLAYSHIHNTSFSGGDLSWADLSWSTLSGANLSGVDLSNANLTGIDWLNTICPDGTNSDNNGNTCENNKNHVQEQMEQDTRDSGPINIPPCSTISSEGLNQTSNPSEWPEIRNGQWLAIDGLTNVSYASIEFDNDSDVVVDYRLDWMCGYTYSVKIPAGYNASNEYPVFLYLHGQIEDSVFFNNMLTNNFHIPEDDKYIIVRPSKLELDWDPKKALDVLEDVKSHLSVDDDRVYLTGLSMGGRGTFIVAAALPEYFAAIMPLSPHHEPYSYLSLAEDVAHLPIWMSHGTEDNTSSFEMAEQMAANLADLGAEIEFHPVVDGGHYIWFPIYSDPSAMQWMLSHVRGQ